jgi:hypothetical protein
MFISIPLRDICSLLKRNNEQCNIVELSELKLLDFFKVFSFKTLAIEFVVFFENRPHFASCIDVNDKVVGLYSVVRLDYVTAQSIMERGRRTVGETQSIGSLIYKNPKLKKTEGKKKSSDA